MVLRLGKSDTIDKNIKSMNAFDVEGPNKVVMLGAIIDKLGKDLGSLNKISKELEFLQ